MMKKKYVLSLFALLLASCSNGETIPTASDSESIEITASDNSTHDIALETIIKPSDAIESNTEEEKPSEEEADIHTGVHTLTRDDIPSTDQSKYNNEFEFQGGDVTYFGDYLQRGNGEHDGSIQMKKGVSYFYSTVTVDGTITLSIRNKGDFTASPSFYIDEGEGFEKVEQISCAQESDNLLYTYEVDNAKFKVADESGDAMYVNYLEVNCED